jgi:aspartate racemase
MVGLLSDGVERLTKAGAQVIAIACNSAHVYIHRIPCFDVELLNIVECTVARAKHLQVTEVGLLAASATVSSGIYSNILQENGIRTVLPSNIQQTRLAEIISELAKDL